MLEVRGVLIEVVVLQVAKTRRMGIEPVIGEDDGLSVLEFREDLRLKSEIPLSVVTLGGRQGSPMGDGPPGEHADPGVLTGFRNGVVGFELFFFTAEITGGAGAEVIRECQENLCPEGLQ